LQALNEVLKLRSPKILVTKFIIATNLLIFCAMLADGAGVWHSSNSVQLAWGANFGPATQDGEWWRLGSAMFLHFGIIHLLLNMWALWDAGQLAERMYGRLRFTSIYIVSGLLGNLLSLVVQGNSAVSGGASGAIFGVYGAILAFMWREKNAISAHEFRWLFWGALGFSIASILFGFIIPGIDNSAHIGGFISGILCAITLPKALTDIRPATRPSLVSGGIILLLTTTLIYNIPAAKYRWGDELLLRQQIEGFLLQEQAINRSWLEIIQTDKDKNATTDELATQIDSAIADRYEQSFEKLSQLPVNPALPSAAKLDDLLKYTERKKDESRALAEKLRSQQSSAIRPQ
jgi:rhomboid protease GluP